MRRVTLGAIAIVLLACTFAFSSQEASAELPAREPSVFDGTLADSLWTVLAFCVLAVALGKFAWKPLLKVLQDREEHIHKQITDAEARRREAERLLDEHKQQGQQILEKVTQEAHKLQREVLEKARTEAATLKEKARINIEDTRAAAAQQLWEQAGDMLLAVGTEVLGRAMTHEDNQRLIEEAVEKLRQEEPGGKK